VVPLVRTHTKNITRTTVQFTTSVKVEAHTENSTGIDEGAREGVAVEQTYRLSSQGNLCSDFVNLRFGDSLILLNISARRAVKAPLDAARIEAY
jgi:hypothetical protein